MSAMAGVPAGGYKTVMSRMSIDWRILEGTARNTKDIEMKMSTPYGVLPLNDSCDRAVQQKTIGANRGQQSFTTITPVKDGSRATE